MKLTEAIKDLQKNNEQWQAFSTEGHVVVHAPPGSGKTKLLATKVAFDLANRIPTPHGVACVTLTNAAADELRCRIEAISTAWRPASFVGTVHSFAYTRILLPFAGIVGRPELRHRSIATKAQVKAAMNAAITGTPGAGNERYVDSTVNVLRNRFATEAQWASAGGAVTEVAQRYLDNLANSNLIDFTGIIEEAVDIVEKNLIVRKVINAKYPHLYVDEYQDLAPGLDRLVRALCFDYFNGAELFAVGDPDQAVYGFNGARPELLDELSQRSDVTLIRLKTNYRSGDEILRVAQFMKHSKSPTVGQRVGGSVQATFCSGGSGGQSLRAGDHVEKLRTSGVALKEIVVICPNNSFCETATTELRRRGFPVFFRNSQDYGQNSLTIFVENCLVWAALGSDQGVYRLGDLQSRWRSLLGSRWDRKRAVDLTQVLVATSEQLDDPACSAVGALRDCGLDIALKREQLADTASEFAAMYQLLTSGPLKNMSTREFAKRVRRSDCVEVTTMTSSKGLEFDHVIILGMNQKLMPHFNSIGDAENMAEDRRKFYVSLTRARESVEIYYSNQIEWTKVTKPAEPSSFLFEAGLLKRVR